MSERDAEINVLQNPPPHPFHHRMYRDSMFVGGPHSVGITTFYNHREQHQDVAQGVKVLKNVPNWEKDSRMIPAEKRWADEKLQQRLDDHALANCHRHGGSMGINTWFNRQEQAGDKSHGLKRFPGGSGHASHALSNSLAFNYDAKDVQHDHHIRRLTTDSRNRWKDFDPRRLPSSPPPSSRKSVRSVRSNQSNGSSQSTSSSTMRVPNLPFPQEYLPKEMEDRFIDRYTYDTADGYDFHSKQKEPVIAGSFTRITSSPRGKKQFYSHSPSHKNTKINTPNARHRKLKLANNRLSASEDKQGYNPMKTSVGILLSSPKVS